MLGGTRQTLLESAIPYVDLLLGDITQQKRGNGTGQRNGAHT